MEGILIEQTGKKEKIHERQGDKGTIGDFPRWKGGGEANSCMGSGWSGRKAEKTLRGV